MTKTCCNSVGHVLGNVPNETRSNDRAHAERNARDPHPLQTLGVRPATADLSALNDCFVDARDAGDFRRSSEIRQNKSLGLSGVESCLHCVQTNVFGETGTKLVDEDVVVGCVADRAADSANAEGESD